MFFSENLTVKEFNKDIELNLNKSHGSYIYDNNTNLKFLDFFSYFSTNPFGYKHPIFESEEFKNDILEYAPIKISSGRIYLKYFDEFISEWNSFISSGIFSKYYFIHGGALAVEAALKVSFDYKREKYGVAAQDLKVISFKNSFHGVSGYTLNLSDLPASKINDFPKFNWKKVSSPILQTDNISTTLEAEDLCLQELEEYVQSLNSSQIAALVVEPIQCSSGDYTYRPEFFKKIREFCNKYDIVMIFDEIQTGFGVTGSLWYWQQLGVEPDILVFGKKAQVCGIAVTNKLSECPSFSVPHRLSVTWDGHILDVVRARHVIKALKNYNIINKVEEKGNLIRNSLKNFDKLKNVRGKGLLISFDLETQHERDKFFKEAYFENLVVNIASSNTIRLRPNLCVSLEEIQDFQTKINKILIKMNKI